jgi:hypothetical protein
MVGENMYELQEVVQKEYEQWENTPPNVVNEKLGKITRPLELALKPFIKKVAPLLEDVVSKTNEYIADAIEKISDKSPDFENMDEKNFGEWFAKADKSANDWKVGGITAMTAEGAATGAGGFALLLIDIPAAFGLILSFSNKIALTYGLPIKNEEIQIAILQAISAGSESSLKEKASAVFALKQAQKTLQMSWKRIYQQGADNFSAMMIVAVKDILQKLGVKVTKRKISQIVPVVGAGIGAAINGAWALDALEAVRQFSRKWIIDAYSSKGN